VLKSDPSTWTDPRHRLGAEAEAAAARLLQREGYSVLEHRFRFQRHDVDLIARRGSTVVFAEVKARAGRGFGRGTEAVTARKQRELVRTAAVWLSRHGRPNDVARFDVITIERGRLDWVQNAFRPGWR
jgi:putative endonuclease